MEEREKEKERQIQEKVRNGGTDSKRKTRTGRKRETI